MNKNVKLITTSFQSNTFMMLLKTISSISEEYRTVYESGNRDCSFENGRS